MNDWLMLALGLGILTAGAELLVRGSAALALRLGISPLIIGLTIVAFGTSSPELAVSLKAALAGQGDIAAGNERIRGQSHNSNVFTRGKKGLTRRRGGLGIEFRCCPRRFVAMRVSWSAPA
jgi:hypothetical protein